MADPRKLGKRGSYRLGRLGARPVLGTPRPAARRPSFTPRRRGPAGAWLLACPAGAAIVVTLLVAVVQAAAGLLLGRALAPGHG